MRVFANLDEVVASVGEHLGEGDWLVVEQDRVNTFADATDDHQWIHVEPERAAAGPFGRTIAHGFLTLSLLPVLQRSVFRVEGIGMGLNYGLNKVRFITPVPVGAKIRASTVLTAADPVPNGVQMTVTTTVQIDGVDKPACVAEFIVRYLRG